MTRMFVT